MHVLIVDDQQSARSMARRVVEELGPDLTVEDLANPVAGLRRAMECEPDLLLLDYRMPEIDGLEFVRRFRGVETNRDVPIVLITVVGDENMRQSALDAGVIDFLVKPIRPRELRARCKNLLELRQHGQSVKSRVRLLEHQVLAGGREIEAREQDTGNHLLRMSRYAAVIAEVMGVPDDEAWMMECAVPMHDIDKIDISDAVLPKVGPQRPAEMAVMRRHSEVGRNPVQQRSNRFVQSGSAIAPYHHERFDGTGYPRGLSGAAIPIAARIMAVADVFDAMTSDTPNQRAGSFEGAVEYLTSQRGALLDPACVDAFLGQLPRVRAMYQAFTVTQPLT